ncbi:MAG: RodZ domain-containing protein [Anaerolineales bacterium]
MSRSLGQELRQIRQELKLSLEDVARGTHIKLRYLEALERDDLESLPTMTQARGFVRVYANFLNQDPKPLLALLDGAQEEGQEAAPYIPYQADEPEPSEAEIALENTRREMAERGDQLMVEIGQRIRQQREVLGLSLEDVERHTHLRKHYLTALENGDLEALPSPVQGRGMLKNYANFLGMDPEPLLLVFAESVQAQHAARQPEPTKPRPPEKTARQMSPLRRLLSGDLFITGGIILLLVVFIGWGVFQIASARSAQTPEPEPPSIADVLVPSPSPTVSQTPAPTTATSEEIVIDPTLAAGTLQPTVAIALPEIDSNQGSLQVYVSARQRAWMRVIVDDEVMFEGQVLVGSVYPFSGFERIEVVTGNGGGLIVYFGEQNLGPMGLFGEVVDRIYTAEGVQTPTPTITPTVTETPRFSPTPPATAMPGGQP